MSANPPSPSAPPPSSVRLLPRVGPAKIRRIGIKRRLGQDLYHLLLTASWRRLAVLTFGLYLGTNLLFAVAYANLPGGIENARPGSLVDAFFFSVQTMATIGYGKLVPHTIAANALVTVEALLGLLGLAFVTGLLFAKFSRPTARVLFSQRAVIGQRDGKLTFMFRIANERGNQIVDAQLRVGYAVAETTLEGDTLRRFYDIPLLRDRNAIFVLSWTAVHVIDATSPLYAQTPETLKQKAVEIIVSITGVDETFSQMVHARYSYTPDEIDWNARYVDIISVGQDGERLIDYGKFHQTEPQRLPPAATAANG